jgi:hypothetical protein
LNKSKITRILVLIGLINFMIVCVNLLRGYLHRQFLTLKKLRDENLATSTFSETFYTIMESVLILAGPNLFVMGQQVKVKG